MAVATTAAPASSSAAAAAARAASRNIAGNLSARGESGAGHSPPAHATAPRARRVPECLVSFLIAEFFSFTKKKIFVIGAAARAQPGAAGH